MSAKVQVSVVIPTYRRNDLLRRCLNALARQTLGPSQFEVLVADDAATNEWRSNTKDMVLEWSKKTQVKGTYVPVLHTRGPAGARNAAWKRAEAAIIAFTDDDTVPAPDWLAQGLKGFRDDTVAIWGRIVVPLTDAPTDHELNTAGLAHAGFVTANCFCRRSILEAVKGFDERFTLAWREDSDLLFSILNLVESAHDLVYQVPEAVVVHPTRPAPWGESLSSQKKAAFNALLFKKHPVLYRKMIQRRPPGRYYVILGAFFAAVTCTWLGIPWLAWASWGLWALLCLRFAWVRLRHSSRSVSHMVEMLVTSFLIPPLAIFWRLYGAIRYRVLFF